jgi:hypothetical protein
MRLVFGILVFCVSVYGYSYTELLRDYEAKNYEKVCSNGSVFLIKNDKNENILIAIGDACAKIDAINPLGNVVKNLISTPENRESGSYFATLVLQKKLIYQFMHDGINLKELRLPRTEHVLSRVFEELAKGNYTTKENKVEVVTPAMDYLLWLSNDEPKKVYIDELKNGQLILRHWYL